MIQVLHLISSLNRGGRERQLSTIVANTNSENYPSRIVYFNKQENSYIDEYGLTDVSIQVKSKGKWPRLLELNQILKKEKPDVIYTWGNGESLSILLLSPFYKFKFINGSVRHGIRSKKFSHYFRTFVLHLSPNIVANSYAGLKANNLRRGMVLYNGIEEKFLVPINNRTAIRQNLTGIPTNIPLIISVANLVPYKDYFSVLKTLKELKERHIDFHYLILGDGPLRSAIEETIKQYDLNENITLLGNVANVSDYLKSSDIFIHSSKGEGCSNAILEAMAAGLPIIASNTGGTPEIVSKECGFLFEYKNHNHLKNYLEILVENDEKRTDYGKKSYNKVATKFNLQRMMNEYYQIIENL